MVVAVAVPAVDHPEISEEVEIQDGATLVTVAGVTPVTPVAVAGVVIHPHHTPTLTAIMVVVTTITNVLTLAAVAVTVIKLVPTPGGKPAVTLVTVPLPLCLLVFFIFLLFDFLLTFVSALCFSISTTPCLNRKLFQFGFTTRSLLLLLSPLLSLLLLFSI